MLEMLKRERDNLAALMASAKENWSQKIVRLYGYNLDHKTPFLVYEFVPGGTLTNYLAKRQAERGSLSPDEVLGLIRQITEALAFAHKRGLVHRDLKPANVLVDGTTLKLADFGIGGIVADHARGHSQIGHSLVNQLHSNEQASLIQRSGTPLYMDPDQRRGGFPNPKHDLYSLGVVWYQLLVGDVTREKADGWDEELASEFKVPKNHIEIMKQCVGWIKNRPNNAGELLKLLDPVPPPPPPLPPPLLIGIPELVKTMKQKLVALQIEISDDLGPVIPQNGELGFSIIMPGVKFCVSIRSSRKAKLLVTRFSETSLHKLRISLDGPKHGRVDYWVINEKKGRFEIDSLIGTLATYKQLLDSREGA